jgi:cobalt-zinc-cadmium efflux system outer membrane protein
VTRVGLCLALACVACVRYEPRPLDPARHPGEVRSRNLADSALLAGVARYAGRPEGARWTDRQLAVAALRLRADLRRLRAEWRAAGAAVRTAGERRRPGIQGELERRVGGREEGSPWVVAVTGLFALELGGKRGARLQAARAGVTLAESRLLAGAWGAVTGTRIAAAELVQATGEVEDARQEVRLLEELHGLERARYAEAALGAAEVARTSTDIQNARLSLAEAEHAVLAARAALAAALAVPVVAVASVEPAITTPAGCSSLDSIGVDAFVAGALGGRHEVSLALGEYALAESRLRLQVARQYPDLELGPGFIWDQGVHRWTLALALPALLGSRNRGAIGEAEAARQVAELEVAEAQDAVFADVESAVQRCRGASLEMAATDSVVAAATQLAQRDRSAYRRGETSRLEPARTELQLLRAQRARRRAERRLTLASLELERAAGEPSSQASGEWPDPRQEPEEEATQP